VVLELRPAHSYVPANVRWVHVEKTWTRWTCPADQRTTATVAAVDGVASYTLGEPFERS
jgi:hypothetical protein